MGLTWCLAFPTGSSQSSHTSKYFGSIDSSENDHSRKQTAGGNGEAQFIKCVLQDPIWLLMADTDEKIMMTYQLPIRLKNKIHRHTNVKFDRKIHLEFKTCTSYDGGFLACFISSFKKCNQDINFNSSRIFTHTLCKHTRGSIILN